MAKAKIFLLSWRVLKRHCFALVSTYTHRQMQALKFILTEGEQSQQETACLGELQSLGLQFCKKYWDKEPVFPCSLKVKHCKIRERIQTLTLYFLLLIFTSVLGHKPVAEITSCSVGCMLNRSPLKWMFTF